MPTAILWLSHDSRFTAAPVSPGGISFWVGLLLAGAGLALGAWTATLFMKFGDGTPAPWDPPKKLVVRGPYRYVRNPMISGVLLMLMAEAILLQSWPIAAWMAFFFLGNGVYFPLVEEKDLERRFGPAYGRYKAHVPRWIPRLRPWEPSDRDHSPGP